MLYRMRRKDGSADPFSSGTHDRRDGNARHLAWSDIEMTPGETWPSPKTGARYPVAWKLAVPSLKLELDCRARFAAQEVVSQRALSPTYWEGAVEFQGHVEEEQIGGVGYLEMTGYDKPIELEPVQTARTHPTWSDAARGCHDKTMECRREAPAPPCYSLFVLLE